MPSLHIHPKVHQPLTRADVAVAGCRRAAKRKGPWSFQIGPTGSIAFLGVFGFFRAARGPGRWFFGAEVAQYVCSHPCEASSPDITILGTNTDFDCASLRNRSRESVCMVAPHSEQTGTCKRTSFQYKVIYIPQGDSYMTTASQDGLWGYLQGRFTVDYKCLGWAYALSFSDCILLIKITICRQTTCIAVRVLTA